MRAARSLSLLLGPALALAACAGSASPIPSLSPHASPPPDVSPQPTPETSPTPPNADLGLVVLPPEDPPEVRMAIPGERVCFLVTVEDPSGSADPVTIAASAAGASIESIEPVELTPGVVGEVWVVPDPSTTETTASVVITASRDGAVQTESRSLPVFPMADERGADAQPYFERWVAWLAAEHPELGITAETDWDPEFVSTLLVVSHYAYWSDEWELTIAWHNMIAPYDWTEVHLRHRWTESAPSLAFKVDSVSGATEPYAIQPPEVVVR